MAKGLAETIGDLATDTLKEAVRPTAANNMLRKDRQ